MPWLCSSANKVQTNVLCCCLIVNYSVALHRTCYTIVCRNRHGIFWGLIFGPGIFLGFAGSPRDFLGVDFWLHSIIPVTWNPPRADFTANFGGKLRQETVSKKQPISLDFFWQISLKLINFVSIWPALSNVVFFLTGIIILLFQQQFAREMSEC